MLGNSDIIIKKAVTNLENKFVTAFYLLSLFCSEDPVSCISKTGADISIFV